MLRGGNQVKYPGGCLGVCMLASRSWCALMACAHKASYVTYDGSQARSRVWPRGFLLWKREFAQSEECERVLSEDRNAKDP